MNREEFSFTSTSKQAEIQGVIWTPDSEPVAVIQLVHGMLEYFERYEDFAKILCKNNVAVVAHNHLGHGNSLIKGCKGYFGDKQPLEHLLGDIDIVRTRCKERFPTIPYFILGHSMGSFLTRIYISQKPSGISGAIICGTSGANPTAETFGKPLSKALWKICGAKKVSKQMDVVFNNATSKAFSGEGSKNSWISSDPKEIKIYDNDKNMKFSFTASAYHTLFSMISIISSPQWANDMDKNLPIFLISGDKDPVGDFGRGVLQVRDALVNAGVQNITAKLYENARHEIIRDCCKNEVYSDVLGFINKHM